MLGRLKFEVDALIEQMLDNIPPEVFESDTTTFLDPAMGGGQFLKAVVSRLRKYGHSDANIAGRVVGYETNKMRVNFAVKQCNNIGTFVAKDFLEEDMSKKFDVIIGNPPYQNAVRSNENTNQGGGKKMYVSMMEKSSNLLKDNGIIAFVVPSAIFKTTTFGKFGVAISGMKNFKILCANTDVSQHFKNVSIKICYFIGQKTDNSIKAIINGEETNYNDLGFYANETELQPIAEKLINNKIPIKIFRDKNLKQTGLTTTRYGYLEFDKTAEETNLFWVHPQPSKLKRLLKTNMFARVAWDGFVILDKRWYHNFWSALYLHPDLNENMNDDEIMDLYGLTQNEKDIINKIDRTKNVK